MVRVRPQAVLVHGLAGSSRWWEPVAAPLERHLELRLVDVPRAGLDEAAADVRSLIDGRAHLIGHSRGATVCARVAATFPELVDRLVLASPASFLESRHLARHALGVATVLRRARLPLLRRVVVDSLRAGVPTLYRRSTEVLRADGRDDLNAIRAPTLLVWGARDPLVPVSLADEYLRVIPSAQLVVLPDAGHVPMADAPDGFARAVLDFLEPRGRAPRRRAAAST